MPFVDYAGVISADPHVTQLLLEAAKAEARDRRTPHVEVRSYEPMGPDWATLTHKSSYVVDLRSGSEALFEGFSRKHRKNVRRAQKNSLDVKVGTIELLDEFYRVLSVSWHSLGSPLYSKAFFEEFARRFEKHLRIFVVRHGDKPVAAALNATFGDRVDGLWAGMLPEGRSLQANYVLYWHMIKHFADLGFSFYSLGRSSADSTAEDHKEKWNAVPRQLYWSFWPSTAVPQPAAMQLKYRVAASIWRRLPQSVTSRVGPVVAHYFP
jgi:CelD/BcsL family acetyltransferase involved in cellulose biosynthesis